MDFKQPEITISDNMAKVIKVIAIYQMFSVIKYSSAVH